MYQIKPEIMRVAGTFHNDNSNLNRLRIENLRRLDVILVIWIMGTGIKDAAMVVMTRIKGMRGLRS